MTAPQTPTPIPAHATTLPDPSDTTTFGARMRALFDWFLYSLREGANSLADVTYQNAMAATEAADAATAVVGASPWVSTTNYVTGQAAISLVDWQTYRRVAPGGVDGTDPSGSALWVPVGDSYLRKSGVDAMTGPLQVTTIGSSANYMGYLPSHNQTLALHSPVVANKAANSSTYLGVTATGTGNGAGFYGKLSAAGGEWGGLIITTTGVRIHSSYSDINPAVPIYFTFKGVDKAYCDQSGVFSLTGLRCRAGTGGSTPSNAVNLFWSNPNMQLWVDAVNLGNLTYSSDYRVKTGVIPMVRTGIARVRHLRPVEYEFSDCEALGFKADGVRREGFIAHEVGELIPSAVEGKKDDPGQVQSLRLDALIAVLVKAVQEQQDVIEGLEADVRALMAGRGV